MTKWERTELRRALADLDFASGCGCCGDHEEKKKALARFAKLLDIRAHPKQRDFYPLARFRTKRAARSGGGTQT